MANRQLRLANLEVPRRQKRKPILLHEVCKMKFGLIRVKQYYGLGGLLPDRANAVLCHEGWKPENPGNN